jgi:phosphoglycolate phosphatase
MKKIFLFDLDGTVTEPKEGITKCVQYALKSFGIEENDLDKLECFIGPPLHKSFQMYYGLNEDDSFEAVRKYRERYNDIGIYECNLFNGIDDVIKYIYENGGKVCLATSKPEVYAIRLLEYYNIDKYFECITGSLMDGGRTEKYEVIEEVFRRINISDEDKQHCIMIGDRMHDIKGAITTGIESIGVKYGYALENELEDAGATYVVETTADLKRKVIELMS